MRIKGTVRARLDWPESGIVAKIFVMHQPLYVLEFLILIWNVLKGLKFQPLKANTYPIS
jgi:hypothetical protein